MPQVFTSPKYQPETLQLLGTSIWVWLFCSNERIPSVNHVQLSVAGLEWPWARPLELQSRCPRLCAQVNREKCIARQTSCACLVFGIYSVCMTLPCAHIFNASRKYPRFEANSWLSVTTQYLRCSQRAQLLPQRNSALWLRSYGVIFVEITLCSLNYKQTSIENRQPINGESCTHQRLFEPYEGWMLKKV